MNEFKDPLMKDLVGFIANASFQTKFEQFFMKHCTIFDSEEEHKLEYMEVYKAFQQLFDEEMKGKVYKHHGCQVNFYYM